MSLSWLYKMNMDETVLKLKKELNEVGNHNTVAHKDTLGYIRNIPVQILIISLRHGLRCLVTAFGLFFWQFEVKVQQMVSVNIFHLNIEREREREK